MSGDQRSPRAGSPAPRTVACPTCGKESAFEPSNRWRPFCSERCRIADLGGWASESYRIAGKPAEDEPADAGKDPEG